MTIMLTPSLEKRLQKLAKAAGHTPERMLKLVAEYGFPAIENYIEKVGRGIAQAGRGEMLTTEQVFSGIEKRRGQRLVDQKQAA